MGKFKQAMYRFFAGRYGTDTLGKVSLWVFCGLLLTDIVLDFFTEPQWLRWVELTISIVSVALMIWMYFRMFSRNIPKRRRENELFCNFFKLRRNRFRDRKTHVYRKCKHCKAVLRLPKSKGKHTVLCPRCHKRFETRG